MIDVAFTPADLRAADVAVVIDVLRATSTATQALSSGYRRVLMVDTLERAYELQAPGRVLAGERGCLLPPGFALGNSPMEATRCYGDELVLATTNGAPATVAAARRAPVVVLACLLNLGAVTRWLKSSHPGAAVQVVCSGTDGAAAFEDIYVAGRICAASEGPRTDAAEVAVALAAHYPSAEEALGSGSNARVLRDVGYEDDIVYCARESVLGTVPIVSELADGVATVVAGPCTVGRMPIAPRSSAPSATSREAGS